MSEKLRKPQIEASLTKSSLEFNKSFRFSSGRARLKTFFFFFSCPDGSVGVGLELSSRSVSRSPSMSCFIYKFTDLVCLTCLSRRSTCFPLSLRLVLPARPPHCVPTGLIKYFYSSFPVSMSVMAASGSSSLVTFDLKEPTKDNGRKHTQRTSRRWSSLDTGERETQGILLSIALRNQINTCWKS